MAPRVCHPSDARRDSGIWVDGGESIPPKSLVERFGRTLAGFDRRQWFWLHLKRNPEVSKRAFKTNEGHSRHSESNDEPLLKLFHALHEISRRLSTNGSGLSLIIRYRCTAPGFSPQNWFAPVPMVMAKGVYTFPNKHFLIKPSEQETRNRPPRPGNRHLRSIHI